jgi:hypothetical protein
MFLSHLSASFYSFSTNLLVANYSASSPATLSKTTYRAACFTANAS